MSKMKTLQHILEEMDYLNTDKAKAQFLKAALDQIGTEKDKANAMLALQYEKAEMYKEASELHRENGDPEAESRCAVLYAKVIGVATYSRDANYFEAAEIILRHGNPNEAIPYLVRCRKTLEEILLKLPGDRKMNTMRILEHVEDKHQLARYHFELGNYRRAAEIESEARTPDYDLIIDSLEKIGDYEKAAEACFAAMDQQIRFSGYSVRESEIRMKMNSRTCANLVKAGNLDKALQFCHWEFRSITSPSDEMQKIFVAMGQSTEEAWNLTADIVDKKILLSGDDFHHILTQKVYALTKAGRHKDATAYLLDQEYPKYLPKAIECLENSGILGREAVEIIISSKLGHNMDFFDKGKLYADVGMWDEAACNYEKFLKDPRYKPDRCMKQLAPIYERLHRWDKAADCYEWTGDIEKAIGCRKQVQKK